MWWLLDSLSPHPGVFYCKHSVVQLKETSFFLEETNGNFLPLKELIPGMCSVKISQPGIIIELVPNTQRIAWLFPLSNSILQYFKIIILVCMVPNFHQILCRMAERRAHASFLRLACRKAYFIV